MKYSQTVQNILQAAYAYAREEKLAYLTPEVTLLCICSQEEFNSSYTACGGDTETLRSDLVSYIEENIDSADGETPVLSALMEYILSYAAAQAANSAREEIDLRHIIYALCQTQDCYASYYLLRQGVDSMELLQAFTQIEQGDTPASSSDSEHVHPHETGQASVDDISLYAPCLNDTLKNTNPLIGREEELDRTMQILCRKDKNNPLHIGEPGVGKTAITYGLVKRLCSGGCSYKSLVLPRLRPGMIFHHAWQWVFRIRFFFHTCFSSTLACSMSLSSAFLISSSFLGNRSGIHCSSNI